MIDVRADLGREQLIISTGKLAKQAGGSVTVQYGGTMVLVTCCCAKKAKEAMGFFPLTVEYQEKTFAAGKIPGGFFKREGRPSEKAILTSRMIDRPIRPLFPKGMLNEVQVVVTVLSYDGVNDPDVLALTGASAALTISEIPFEGPIAGARVGMVDDRFILNPTAEEMEKSTLDVILVANEESVIMLEAGAEMVSEDRMVEAIKFGHEGIKPLLKIQDELRERAGKPKREDITIVELDQELFKKVKEKYSSKIKEALQIVDKQQRIEELDSLEAQLIEEEADPEKEGLEADLKLAFAEVEKDLVREVILKDRKRIDGRQFDEIRPLSSEVNMLPRTHGSALFTRGETQALAVVTLGTVADEQRIDALEGETTRSFMLHYNFPSFSVGETRPMRGPGRREIGHGALAHKALTPVLPEPENFPYTIRIVSEILESNGSSSMATVCSGSMCLMGGGVPIKESVGGIAMGLVKEDDNYAILTDIAGAEDHLGDMDFKVAGTRTGITAVQMDLKVKGINYDILKEGFENARKARLSIIDHMEHTIARPREDMSPDAPRIVVVMVPVDKIREVIGPGGKVIKGIIAETGADVNIEDDGTCQIASSNKESLDKAVEMVKGLIEEPEVGKTYEATVVKIMDFGAFVRYMPNQEGLVHVSEISNEYVKDVHQFLKEGQEVKVKLVGIDDQGRAKLSMKQVEEKQVEENKDTD
ncbi:MAG: polyribonucleotide nucleotidyltransferase [Candidatus Omnitrophica bacterium]|nr:polyribonucleotide nucleotidyltransferase [Candidatus Omnitrophota bacterium]